MISPSRRIADYIVTPMSKSQEERLRFENWILTNRKNVTSQSNGNIGYFHFRELFRDPMATLSLARNYPGIILDLRYTEDEEREREGEEESDDDVEGLVEMLMQQRWIYWKVKGFYEFLSEHTFAYFPTHFPTRLRTFWLF